MVRQFRHVLVLGDDSRSCLTVARSLGRHGLQVTLGLQDPASIVPASRYVTRAVPLPSTSGQVDAWLNAVQALATEHRVDLIIPTSDEALVPIAQHREAFAGLAPIAVPDERAFQYSYLKHLTFAMAAELGVPAPRTVTVLSPGDLDRIDTTDFSLPLIVKPSSSRVWKDGRRIDLKVSLARDESELRSRVGSLLGVTPVLVQEFSRGIGVGQEFLAHNGEILSAFQHERVHEPIGGGGSSYRRSVPLDPAMLAHSRAMLRHMKWTGVAMIEYKRDPASGGFVLIEINGRFWGSLPLAVAAGADFPFELYELLVRGRRPAARGYRVGVYCRNVLQDCEWFRENLTADRGDPFLITRPPSKVLAEVWNVVGGRERWDTLTVDDPLPGLLEFTRALRALPERVLTRAARALRQQTRSQLVRLRPWRRRRQAELRRILGEHPQILFVCKGNICRSPFAEAYARQKLSAAGVGAVELRSAGHYPSSGRPAPYEARVASRDFGMDLEQHRSRRLSNELVGWAGAVMCMDFEDCEYIRQAFPEARGRVFFLREFTNEASPGPCIPDPWGHPVEDFRNCYRLIAACVDGVADTLAGAPGVR